MTEGGEYLDNMKVYDLFDDTRADSLWRRLSGRFASGASGEVGGFVEGARENRAWAEVEKPILKQRGIKINYNPEKPCL